MYHSSPARFLDVQNVLCNATLPGVLPTRGSPRRGRQSILDWGSWNRVPGLPRVSTTNTNLQDRKRGWSYVWSVQAIPAIDLHLNPTSVAEATGDRLQVQHGSRGNPNDIPILISQWCRGLHKYLLCNTGNEQEESEQCVCLTYFVWYLTSNQKCHVTNSKTQMNVNRYLHFLLKCHMLGSACHFKFVRVNWCVVFSSQVTLHVKF